MIMAKISVLIVSYNYGRFLRQCIESVLTQTCSEDLEIVLVDDGSTDDTLAIIKSFDDSRIVLINQENMGPGASRNNALKLASGKYVMYLDGDDWFSPDAVEIAYNEANGKETDFTFFQMLNYDDETGKVYENDWFNLNIFDESFEDCVFKPADLKTSIFDLSVGVCQKIYDTSFLRRIDAKFPEGIFFEDMPFFYYVYLKAERISLQAVSHSTSTSHAS